MFDNDGWEQSPILYQYYQERIKKDPELAIKLRINRGIFLKKELEYRTKGRNAIIAIKGQTGGGKSWAGVRIAYWINRLYKTKNKPVTFFTAQEALDALPNIQTPNTMHIDEQIRQTGTGSGRTIAEFRTLEETIRAKQLSIIFCSPTLQPHIAHFILEAYGIKPIEKLSKLILYTPDEIPIGYVILKAPTTEMLISYNKQKQEFLDKIQQRTIVGGGTRKTAEDCLKNSNFMNEYSYCSNKMERLALIISKYHTGKTEAEEVAAMIEILKRKL